MEIDIEIKKTTTCPMILNMHVKVSNKESNNEKENTSRLITDTDLQEP